MNEHLPTILALYGENYNPISIQLPTMPLQSEPLSWLVQRRAIASEFSINWQSSNFNQLMWRWTPGILEKILNLQYHSASATGDFKEYFNSFLLETNSSSVIQQTTLYKTLHSGGGALLAADLQLSSNLEIKASTDTVSYLYLIQKYLIYHQCLWEGAHPVTTSLATYYWMLNQKQVELQMYQFGCEIKDRLLFWPRLQFKL